MSLTYLLSVLMCSLTAFFSAACYNAAFRDINDRKSLLLQKLAPEFLTRALALDLATKFPKCKALTEAWLSGGTDMSRLDDLDLSAIKDLYPTKSTLGIPSSVWNNLVHYGLHRIVEDPHVMLKAEQEVRTWRHWIYSDWRMDLKALIKVAPKPWAVTSREETYKLGLIAHWDPLGPEGDFLRDHGRVPSYSAASAAIRFLKSLDKATRAHIRRIDLLEDYQSAADPASHAIGLIPFLQENLNLRIDRIVNLWRSVFFSDIPDDKFLDERSVVKSIGRWIVEALELGNQGMPEGRFQLTFDGSMEMDQAVEVFKKVCQYIACQAALDPAVRHEDVPLIVWRQSSIYSWEGLPQVLMDLQMGSYSTLIRFNFDIGTAPDTEKMIRERSSWELEDWEESWAERDRNGGQVIRMDWLDQDHPPYKSLRPHCKYALAMQGIASDQ